jgi:hypothetical protein
LKSEFENKISELLNSDDGPKLLGIQRMAQFHTRAGVSSLTSGVGFLNAVDEDDFEKIPDYILSDTLEKDLDATISVCALILRDTKYFPKKSQIGTIFGAAAKGEREGLNLKSWEDYEIVNFEGKPLYTEEILSKAEATGQTRLAMALWLIVKDICDDGRMPSKDWYGARMLYEYFREHPIKSESAFLIGALFKELCIKQTYEGDLSTYYLNLADAQLRRQRGAESTKNKAEELREFCVELYVEIADEMGARFMLAPLEVQAIELRRAALEKWPEDFIRSGKPYSIEWFSRNIIEDRKVQIVEGIENRRR